jgi:hypothetical protein
MRKQVLWRLTPTAAEEHFIRNAALKEGRKLSDMTHKLLSEAIQARQAAQHQTAEVQRLASLLREPTAEPTQ